MSGTKKFKDRGRFGRSETLEGEQVHKLKHPDFSYVSVTYGGVDKPRMVMELSDVNLPEPPVECYRTWCRYSPDYYDDWIENGKRVRGYKGQCYSDFFPVDIDSPDLERSLEVCQNFVRFLEAAHDLPLDSLRIFFSGSKGFHIEIPTSLFGDIKPSRILPYVFRAIAENLKSEGSDEKLGFVEVDTRIYRQNGLWRLPNSINSKRGLYKISLSVKDILCLSIQDILKMAEKPMPTEEGIPYDDWHPVESVCSLYREAEQSVKHIESESKMKAKAFPLNSKHQPNFEGVEAGKRNDTAFKIAQTVKSKGMPLNEAKAYIIEGWNPKNIPPESNIASLKWTVESAYSYDVSDSGSIELTKHLRNDPYYNSLHPEQKSVYIYIMTHLNEKEKVVWEKYSCGPNQMIYSYSSLSANTDVSKQKVRTLLDNLEEWGRISIETLRSEKGHAECSRLTFHAFDVTQHVTQNVPEEQEVEC